MLACICAIYILCHKLVHYTTCTTAGRAVTSLTTSTFSSITQRISGNSEKLYTIVASYNVPGLATFKGILAAASSNLSAIYTDRECKSRKAITYISQRASLFQGVYEYLCDHRFKSSSAYRASRARKRASSEYRFRKFLFVTSLALAAAGPVNHKWESRVARKDSSVKNPNMIRNPFRGTSLNHLHKRWTACTAPPWKHHQSFMWDQVVRIIHDTDVKPKGNSARATPIPVSNHIPSSVDQFSTASVPPKPENQVPAKSKARKPAPWSGVPKYCERLARIKHPPGGSAMKFSHEAPVPRQPSIPDNFALCKGERPEFMCLETRGSSGARPAAFDADTIDTIGIDNRCSKCISNVRSDFVGKLIKEVKTIHGYHGAETKTIYRGLLQWRILDDEGNPHVIQIPNGYYDPKGTSRLISPQHWAQARIKGKDKDSPDGTYCKTYHDRTILAWGNDQFKRTVPLDTANCFTLPLAPGFTAFHDYCKKNKIDPSATFKASECCMPTYQVQPAVTVSEGATKTTASEGAYSDPKLVNLNGEDQSATTTELTLESPKKEDSAELLRYHFKYGHVPFRRLQEMAQQGTIPPRLGKCPIPPCATCMFGKAHRRPKQSKSKKTLTDPEEVKAPGDLVSVDVLVSSTPGLVAQMAGFLTRKRYKYACVFVDHFSDFGYVYMMKEHTANEALDAKLAFEAYSEAHGIEVKRYHADNGVCATQQWKEDCYQQRQLLTLAGVNAHHQNGKVERRIRTLQDLARCMLIHANHRWTSAISVNLWPYALREANDVLNHTNSAAHRYKSTPYQVFSRTEVDNTNKHRQPLFCPVYVLEAPLQSDPVIYDKWKARCRVGIYLGRSPSHARSVALVLNLATGRVSPQYHVVFDPAFATVSELSQNPLPKSDWQRVCGFEGKTSRAERARPADDLPIYIEPADTPGAGESSPDPPASSPGEAVVPPLEGGTSDSRPSDHEQPGSSMDFTPRDHDQGHDSPAKPSSPPPQTPAKRYPARERRSTKRSTYNKLGGDMVAKETLFVTQMEEDAVEGEILAHASLISKSTRSRPPLTPIGIPLQAKSATSDPDTMYYHQAMKQPDREKFIQAARDEFDSLLRQGVMSIVPASSVSEGASIFPAVWAMRRKRRILTREVYKWKARLNLDGSKQVAGRDYDDTYAPVASWETVRMLLGLSLKNNWKTRQLDYVLAFPQAPVERECYMRIPQGIGIKDDGDWVLKIHKNIYGQKQGPRVWNQYLIEKLRSIGFVPSDADENVFYRGRVIYLLYTDDSIAAAPTDAEIDQVLHDLIHKAKLKVTDEGKIQDFLGVNIDKVDDKTYHLSQPQLIDQILEDLNLMGDSVKTKDTPAPSSRTLTAHPDGDDFDEHFHYRSVIGKLNHLEKCTRPDISYQVHQCARYSSKPKRQHGEAVKWLGRYLLATRDKGYYLHIDEDEGFTVWADSDFSGNWDPEHAMHDPNTARSRSGYFITYLGAPLMWKSSLQTEIALSTCEAEYICLSQALRKVIPIMDLVQELKDKGVPVGGTQPTVKCKMFEDNSAALTLANAPAMRPRTKHINVKYHFFRRHVYSPSNPSGRIKIMACKSEDNIADILTKPVDLVTLLRLRYRAMGW
jgi:hypothetical protein